MNDMEDMLNDISKKDFEKQKYVELAISNPQTRDFIVENMINNSHIMKYYHCFDILEEVGSLKPELLYKYWDEIYKLLFHSNSYHRNFGLILLAQLAKIDEENKFIDIIDDYLNLLNDDRIMTAEACIKNVIKIASIKPELSETVVDRLLDFENSIKYSEKQKAVIMSFLIEGFHLLYENFPKKDVLFKFVKKHIESISPKTRKVAKNFINKYK
ncbi:MAG: hypothetical protein GF383_07625 [Candidatus Lokiarchaeota archaeon]|nr:hypothetical protein [Candidatus Lokiarchaeota archaeon]MBD3340120.1 hypothetical protein [Candidatus Lokiarchaeota archaeon]